MPAFLNLAAYKFTRLAELRPLRERLVARCREGRLKGTILLSPEGINCFVAGEPAATGELLAELRAIPGLGDLQPKISESDAQPFSRMLVRIKREIIAFGVEGIDPAARPAPKVAPRALKAWLDEGRPVTLLDTRNDYEVRLGTFRGARALGIDHFRDFPAAAKRLPGALKDQPVVMFCTGGIRCEKAGPFLEREGFRNVFQLEGGILKYFEECGGAHYDGECFVFDRRVGVDPALRETASALCFRCQSPLTPEEQRDPRYEVHVSCPHCHRSPAEKRAGKIASRHEAIRRATSPLPGSAPRDNFRPIQVPPGFDGASLLETLTGIFRHVPAAEWRARGEAGRLLDERRHPLAADHRVRGGERYLLLEPRQVEPDVAVDIAILHEDEAILVLQKPAPLPMHPAGRYHRNTLQSILNAVYAPQNPRPAHRLDANTTGVLVCARTRHFAARLQPQFEAGTVEKVYLARIQGSPAGDAFICDAAIGDEPHLAGARKIDLAAGRPARTAFAVLGRFPDGTALVEARPLTGRTNQIRLHLQHLGWPVAGDRTYLPGGRPGPSQTLRPGEPPLCLHARRLAFDHPVTGERLAFEASAPPWAELPNTR